MSSLKDKAFTFLTFGSNFGSKASESLWKFMKFRCRRVSSCSKKAFTLIELLVVISIISLLSSVVLASLNSARAKARNVKRLSDIRQYSLVLALAYDDDGEYPDPGDTNWRCLGDYPDDKCWGNNGVGTSEDAAVNAILDRYLPVRPADTNILGSWEGYIYSCTRIGDLCQIYDIRWFMEGTDQSCGGGELISNNYNSLGITYCRLARSYGD